MAYFCDLKNDSVHTHATRNSKNLHKYRVKHAFAQKCLRFTIIDVVNKCPDCIKNKVKTHSFQGFNNYVKQYFIDQYNEECSIRNCYICNRLQ